MVDVELVEEVDVVVRRVDEVGDSVVAGREVEVEEDWVLISVRDTVGVAEEIELIIVELIKELGVSETDTLELELELEIELRLLYIVSSDDPPHCH